MLLFSVTENEITQGMLVHAPALASSTCLCIIRDIVDINSQLSQPRISRFIDLQTTTTSGSAGAGDVGTVVPDNEASALLTELRQRKVTQRLDPSNITSFQLDWKTASLSTDQTNASSSQEGCDKVGDSETSCDDVGDHKSYITAL